MGVLLALLLGVAAAFFVLAMPIRMLETVTTLTRLSKLMVQAEPPISPNDRTLLSVLAGVLTAGIGWVMVDWLIFGRAGMGMLIRSREDDYEEEDEGHFRPTDPLDLVSPMGAPGQDWPSQQAGDFGRPLSARTDIGDPPVATHPFGAAEASVPGIDRPVPPLSDILPGAGVTPPPLQSHIPPALSQSAPPDQARSTVSPEGAGLSGALPPSWLPPVPPPSLAPEISSPVRGAEPEPAVVMPSWLPAPGSRQAEQPAEALEDIIPLESSESLARVGEGAADRPVDEPILPVAEARPVPPLIPEQPLAPPPGAIDGQAVVPPFFTDFTEEPAPPSPPWSELSRNPAELMPRAVDPLRAPPHPLPEPSFDRERLEDLLGRLERGLQRRRAAARMAAESASAVAPPSSEAAPSHMANSVPPVVHPESGASPRSAPPAGFIASIPAGPVEPPAPSVPAPPAAPSTGPGGSDGGNDDLLDQPLHVALDRLRNMVRR